MTDAQAIERATAGSDVVTKAEHRTTAARPARSAAEPVSVLPAVTQERPCEDGLALRDPPVRLPISTCAAFAILGYWFYRADGVVAGNSGVPFPFD